jgi:O-antigen/teichoic acid export membrane protein
MKLDFAKNTRRNAAAAIINRFIGALFPFLNRSLFLWLLGPSYLGLNGLFGSILGFLILAELGFSTAVVCSMYKPVAEDDQELLCAYLAYFRKVYQGVGTVILLMGLCLFPFLRQLVHGEVPPDINMHVLYLLHLLNTTCSYFFFAYRGSILSAYHRQDVVTNIRTVVSMIQYVAVFLVLFLTRNYYYYVIVTIVFTMLQNILIMHEARRLFPKIVPVGKLPEALRKRVLDDIKSIFLHKVGGTITYSSDNIIISMFLGLVVVAAYGNYYYISNTVAGITWAMYQSMTSGFGNRIYTDSREENFQLFMRANRMVSIVIIWCAAMMTALYQPFIYEWTRGKPDLLCHFLTPVLMVLYFYVNQSRQVLLSFKSAAALWRHDRWKPVVAGIINLTLNITFVKVLPQEFKLDGVILSTIISFVFVQIPWESHVMFTKYFDAQQSRRYWRFQATFALLAVAMCAISWSAVSLVHLGRICGLLAKGAVAFAVSGGLCLLAFRQDILDILRRLLPKKQQA